jgi:hypothetical protein
MSLYEYKVSQEISAKDLPFYALIMAAFRKADSINLGKLRCAFPLTWLEFIKRYNAPGGRLGEELLEQVVKELPKTILGRTVVVKEVGPRHVNLVLGSFDFYDYHLDSQLEKLLISLDSEEPDGA